MASFVRSLVKHAVKHIGDSIGGGVIPFGSIAVGVYEEMSAVSPSAATATQVANLAPPVQAQMLVEMEKVAQDPKGYRQQVETMLAEMATGQSLEVIRAARTYLQMVPGRIQTSLRRPDDPTGKTVPPGLTLRKADDLKQFLPDHMPRFKQGDAPLAGTDLTVLELLGVGGFGEVWKAVHRSRPHAQPVALKFCTDESAARTLRKEVELLDRLTTAQGRHPGIVELKYAHLEGDTPCLEYEFIEGGDLGGLIDDMHKAKKANPLQMTILLQRLAQAVGHAHRLSPPVVHRDLKPANVLTTRVDGHVVIKVADFGIGGLASSQALSEWSRDTQGTAVTQSAGTCTPLYASPQQRRFGPPDPRDDVYALGVIWFQLLSGDVTKEPPRGRSWQRKFIEQGATNDMLALLERCLEDDPADRPADAKVLAEELSRVINAMVPELSPAIPAVAVAAAVASPPSVVQEQWFYTHGGKQFGPVTLADLKNLTTSGQVLPTDLVWTAKLGNWAGANTIKGLCPDLPPAPPPPPIGHVALTLLIPPSGDAVRDTTQKLAQGYLKIASYGLLGGKIMGTDVFKVYLDELFLGEGPYKEGFELRHEGKPAVNKLEIVHWRGNKEIDRKTFELKCDRAGEYTVRFIYVKSLLGGMQGSTIEYLKRPT